MNSQHSRPGMWTLLGIWTSIGLQSFGGGASTTFLIYRVFVEKRGWLLPEEYNHFWNLCVMAPGINLVGMTILIGRKLGGARGVCASLVGLLVPSAAITCLLTAGFVSVQRFPATQSILQGVIPATAGIMLVVAIKYAQPILKELRAEGIWRLLLGLALVALATLAITRFQVAIAFVLIGTALLSILFFRHAPRQVVMQSEVEAAQRETEEIHD
ncbi:MAG TPA: chromate transporter [Ktedonobacteraceae bacterium]